MRFIRMWGGLLAAGLWIAAPPVQAAATIDLKAVSAMNAMKALNVIVLGDWSASNEVEGKVWVGGAATGSNSTNVGIGAMSSAADGKARYSGASDYGVLTVLGDVSAPLNVSNGVAANGRIGRLTVNGAITDGRSDVKVGGSVTGNLIVNDTSHIMVGGSLSGGLALNKATTSNGVSHDAINSTVMVNKALGTLSENASNTIVQAYSYSGSGYGNQLGSGSSVTLNTGTATNTGWSVNAGQSLSAATTSGLKSDKDSMTANMQDLVSQLASLAVNGTVTNYGDAQNTKLLFNVTNPSSAYSVFTISAAALASQSTIIGFKTNGSAAPIVVNVTGVGSGFTWKAQAPQSGDVIAGLGGIYDASISSQIIWNIVGTTSSSIAVSSQVFGSLLDPYGTISNSTPINGTVVANVFAQGGEVHLGTLAGDATDSVSTARFNALATAVPEPATWAMMGIGFGAIGATTRRKRRPSTTAAL